MKCGHCRKDHETVAEVRRCSGIDATPSTATGDFNTVIPAQHSRPASNPGRRPWENVPEGHYAVPGQDGRDLDFYRVDKPTEGSWRGWTFLKMIIGGKPAVRIKDWERIDRVLTKVAENPDLAAFLYGTNIGQCDRCNRHLTDETSRKYGRGPECRAKYGSGYFAAA